MINLNKLISEREAELAALRNPIIRRLVERNPDCTLSSYLRSDGKGVIFTLCCHLGKVEEDCPLELLASCYATENGYSIRQYRLLHEEPGLIVRLYISAEKPFSPDERKLLAAMGVLKKTRPVQKHLVCRV
jgi:hypothetical protein